MAKITKETVMGELIREHPETVPILLKFGLHCIGCPMSSMETIEQGTLGHGLTEEQLDALLKELNEAVEKKEQKE